MPIEKNEPAEQPKVEDLIAAAVGAQPEEVPGASEPEANAQPGESAHEAPPEAEAEGDEPQAGNEPAAAAEPAESPEEAAVTKELADLGITKPDSQARFRELANEAKEGRQIRERYEQQQQVFQHMEREGVTGEQFGLMVMVAGDVNSNDPARLKRAHEVLSAELAGLSKKLGIEAAGFDPLSAHPDIARKVEDGEIDRGTALAWARDKSQAALASENQQRQAQHDTASQAAERARAELTQFGNELQQKDPFYNKVYQLLVPSLRPVLARLPPSEWVSATADAYRDLRGQLQAAGQLVTEKPAATVKRPDPANAGRPNGAAGSPEPKSGQDAIMKMFGYSES